MESFNGKINKVSNFDIFLATKCTFLNYLPRFRPPITFLPGDEMRVICEFDSTSRSEYTYYGEATTDEMCFATYTYYPNQRTTNWITMGNLGEWWVHEVQVNPS